MENQSLKRKPAKIETLTNHDINQFWFQPCQELPAEADAFKIHIHPAIHFKFLTSYHLCSKDKQARMNPRIKLSN